MLVAIHQDERISYPSADGFYSPAERFPEYPFETISKGKNDVYRGLRECLAEAGLDRANYGKKTWNPLGDYIRPGDKVFVLCNFVKHNDLRRGQEDFFAKCTHGSVVRAVIDCVLLALKGKGEVAFGNAPLQSCDWSLVVRETGAERVHEFYRQCGFALPKIQLLDLRQHIIRRNLLGAPQTMFHAEGNDCVEINLDRDSLLEHFYGADKASQPRFRVLDYDPRRTERCHGPGRHVYMMNRQILRSNVVISVPKLKTHEKVGVTLTLKGCVGTVSHKDCLAHHRYGSPRRGGDDYPDGLAFLRVLPALHEYANSHRGSALAGVAHLTDYMSRKVVRRFTRSLGGAWEGNDTCWRMALDLARVVEYGSEDGTMCETRQRKHLVVTDGIIGGEAEGPLNPKAVHAGYLSFSDNPVASDYIGCVAMGFDPKRIPLIREAFSVERYPLISESPHDWDVRLNEQRVTVERLSQVFIRQFAASRGWRKSLNSR